MSLKTQIESTAKTLNLDLLILKNSEFSCFGYFFDCKTVAGVLLFMLSGQRMGVCDFAFFQHVCGERATFPFVT